MKPYTSFGKSSLTDRCTPFLPSNPLSEGDPTLKSPVPYFGLVTYVDHEFCIGQKRSRDAAENLNSP